MNFRKHILVLLLLAILIAPRLSELDSFVTIDEPFWLSVGANFYYALGQREFENTVFEYHPAVTTMWFVTIAFLVYFPEYRGLGQGYFDVDKNFFDPFLIEHGKDPMTLLYISRLLQVAVIILFALIIFYLLSRLIGEEKAFLITAMTSSAPFFLGHSRVLSHEAMVAFFVLTSILGMMAYLEYERKWIYLFISAASAALAQLTKSSAMAMFPVIALMLAVSVFSNKKECGLKSALVDRLKIFGAWFALLALAYFILWPGMWVAPGKMLYEVYGNAFSYAFQGARLQVTQQLQPSQFGIDAVWGTARSFATSVASRATIIVWVGATLAFASFFLRGRGAPSSIERRLILYLFTAAAMFILLFSLARGRNSAHYIMTSHVSVDMIAALGWGIWLGWLSMHWETAAKPAFKIGSVGLILFLQLGSALLFYPYYYNYFNPIVGVSKSEYGEGFEKAAAYLAQKPDAESLKVLSFRARGPFSYFFPGETIILNPLFVDEVGMPSMLERLEQADYLVINDAFGPRTERTALFVRGLDGVEPEKVIEIYGIYPIRIYRMTNLPSSFYETISK